jgi:cell wall-associated NlpC family hydrolase
LLRARALIATWGTLTALIALVVPPSAVAQSGNGSNGGVGPGDQQQTPPQQQSPPPPSDDQQVSAQAGGRAYGQPDPMATPMVPGALAQVVDGVAYAPADAPDPVKQVIWAGNQIVGLPYMYGGGHKDFVADGYDCSGTVSYALHGADLLKRPRDSRSFYRFGLSGLGTWVTVFTNPGHAYMTVAGIRLDTSAADDPTGAKGPQWRPLRKSDHGYRMRHPLGL